VPAIFTWRHFSLCWSVLKNDFRIEFAVNQPSHDIVACPQCGAGNRVPAERRGSSAARCGRCKALLFGEAAAAGQIYKLRCSQCGVKNRVPAARLEASPTCGKCRTVLDTSAVHGPQPIIVTDGAFEREVLRSPLPVLMFAWAPWCPTCVAVQSVIEQFGAETKGRVRVGKLNVDANPGLADRFSIMSVPSLFIFDNGELKERLAGALQKHELMLKMAAYV
jgi:thioredoxin 2